MKGSSLAKDTGLFNKGSDTLLSFYQQLLAFIKYSAKVNKVHSNVSSPLNEAAHYDALQMDLHESAQHGIAWTARPQHNAQIPSAPPMSWS